MFQIAQSLGIILVNTMADVYNQDINRLIAHEIASGMKHFASYIRDAYVPTIEIIAAIIDEGVSMGFFRTSSPMYVVLNIISFITTCRQSQEFLPEPFISGGVRGGEKRSDILSFILEHTFRALGASGRDLDVPDPSRDIREMADAFIVNLKNEFEQIYTKAGA